MPDTISLELRGEIAELRLVRARINVGQVRELERACDQLEDDDTSRVLVIRGHSLGIDFADFDPAAALDIHGFGKWEKLLTRIERLPKILVFAADGPCVGGGMQLMLVADIRVALPSASFSLPEVQLGFLPGMATWRLAKYVGLGHAKRIVLEGEVLDPPAARLLGLLDDVVDDLDAGVAAAVERLGPRHVVAATLARRLLLESFGVSAEDALGHFLAAQHRAIAHSTFKETLRRERGGG